MIDYRILNEHKLVVICNWGVTPVEDVINLNRRLRVDPDFSPSYDMITDNSHLERSYSTEEMRLIAQQLGSGSFSNKVAITALTDVMFGTNRLLEMMTERKRHNEMRVFRRMDNALEWLGRDGLNIESILKKIMGHIK